MFGLSTATSSEVVRVEVQLIVSRFPNGSVNERENALKPGGQSTVAASGAVKKESQLIRFV